MKLTHAPFTPAQVRALNRWQTLGHVHPFTCGNPHPRCGPIAGPFIGRFADQRVLIATLAGWICSDPNCDYVQTWAHEFMTTYFGD